MAPSPTTITSGLGNVQIYVVLSGTGRLKLDGKWVK